MITLTVKEIKDLAEFAGFTLNSRFMPRDEDMETEISITTEPHTMERDDGVLETYAHCAWFSEYAEDGGIPLGEPMAKG